MVEYRLAKARSRVRIPSRALSGEGVANHEIHDEAAPLFYYKCEGKLQKRVHMLPVHPGGQMSRTCVHLDVPEAMKSFCNIPFPLLQPLINFHLPAQPGRSHPSSTGRGQTQPCQLPPRVEGVFILASVPSPSTSCICTITQSAGLPQRAAIIPTFSSFPFSSRRYSLARATSSGSAVSSQPRAVSLSWVPT